MATARVLPAILAVLIVALFTRSLRALLLAGMLPTLFVPGCLLGAVASHGHRRRLFG